MHSYLTGLHSVHKVNKLHKNQSFVTRFTRLFNVTEDPEYLFKVSSVSQTTDLSYGVGEDAAILLSYSLLSTRLRKFLCLQYTATA